MLGVRTALCCLAWGLIGVISACRAQNACPDQTRFLCTTDTAGKRDTAVSVVRLIRVLLSVCPIRWCAVWLRGWV